MGEEFRVSMSGPTAAFFLYDVVNRPVDFEGLLFGDYRRCLHREISDYSDAGDQNKPCTIIHDIYIRRIVPTGVRFSFYDRRFKPAMPDYVTDVVNEMKGKEMLAGGENGSAVKSGLLGWFRYQKCSPIRHRSELLVSQVLSTVDALRNCPTLGQENEGSVPDVSSYFPWPGNGPLYLFSHPVFINNILEWDMQLKAFNSSTNQFRPVRMQIRNLGDTTHADYWKLGSGGTAASAGVDHLLPGLIPPDFSKIIIDVTDQMANNAKTQLNKAFEKVVNESQKTLEHHRRHKADPGYVGASAADHFVRYGYYPSVREIDALLANFQSMVGSNYHATGSTDVNSVANLSQQSGDLFDAPPTSPSGKEDRDGDALSEEWEKVEGEPTETQVPELTTATVEIPVSVESSISPRGFKRPKENTSSSSSCATSDECPETTTTTTASTAKLADTKRASPQSAIPHLTGQRGKSPNRTSPSASSSLQIPKSEKDQSQVRKKSKGSLDGSSSTETPSTMKSMSGPPGLAPSGRGRGASLLLPFSRPSSNSQTSPMPPKGRGKNLEEHKVNRPPPPGFRPGGK